MPFLLLFLHEDGFLLSLQLKLLPFLRKKTVHTVKKKTCASLSVNIFCTIMSPHMRDLKLSNMTKKIKKKRRSSVNLAVSSIFFKTLNNYIRESFWYDLRSYSFLYHLLMLCKYALQLLMTKGKYSQCASLEKFNEKTNKTLTPSYI